MRLLWLLVQTRQNGAIEGLSLSFCACVCVYVMCPVDPESFVLLLALCVSAACVGGRVVRCRISVAVDKNPFCFSFFHWGEVRWREFGWKTVRKWQYTRNESFWLAKRGIVRVPGLDHDDVTVLSGCV